MHKVWIALVTCANNRAIYLDLVPDCTAKCCVDDLQVSSAHVEHQNIR